MYPPGRDPSPMYSRPYSAMAEKLSDRLEITELSDHEDADNFGSPSRSRGHTKSGNNIGLPQPYKPNKTHNGHNIFDIPSGLY